MIRFTLLAFLVFGLTGCSSSDNTSELLYRDMTQSEAMRDFEEIYNALAANYGPYEYKERRFGYSIEQLAEETRQTILSSSTDAEYFGAYAKFLGSMRDGHVGVRFTRNADPIVWYRIPLFVTPVGDDVVVAGVEDSIAGEGIEVGDVVRTVDGKNPWDVGEIATGYDALGSELSDLHSIHYLFNRAFYMTDLIPTESFAIVEVEKEDGTRITVDLSWRQENRDIPSPLIQPVSQTTSHESLIGVVDQSAQFNEFAESTFREFGAFTPFFVTAETDNEFQFEVVQLTDEMMDTYGVSDIPFYAATYEHQGDKILVIRQSGYAPHYFEDIAVHIAAYRAVLDQMDDEVDGLVIDQTHNPGGYLYYADQFVRLFINEATPGLVQANNADRKWINEFQDWARSVDPSLESEASLRLLRKAERIEEAYDNGERVSHPMSFNDRPDLQPDDLYTWKKPTVLLINELAGSCGDIVPMLMKSAGAATLFGQPTMGLGGNVQSYGPTANSGTTFRLTRGLFTTYSPAGEYTDASFVENSGVSPDVFHDITLTDFRGGFTGYVAAFSEEISKKIATSRVGVLSAPILTEVTGNQNGIIEPGESIALQWNFTNQTPAALTDLSGEVALMTPVTGVTLTQNLLTWSSIAVDQTATSEDSVLLELTEDVVCGTEIPVSVELATGERSLYKDLVLNVGERVEGDLMTFGVDTLPIEIPDLDSIVVPVVVAGAEAGMTSLVGTIEHTYPGDLSFVLSGPSGNSYDLQVTVTDNTITIRLPGQSLTTEEINGEWLLEITDDADADVGALIDLELNVQPVSYICE